jgi:proline iminopeptidase
VQLEVAGTRLWFDVNGPVLVPADSEMRRRPTVLLLHGGPFSYDHSYFKPHLDWLSDYAQVIYLDLRGHGRSEPVDASTWSLELCADDVAEVCRALGIARPVVIGHSMGAAVALLTAIRHPDLAELVVVVSGFARWDHARLVEGFRTCAGDAVSLLADTSYSGADVTDEEWAPVFAAFGPNVPDEPSLARRVGRPELGAEGMTHVRAVDLIDALSTVRTPVVAVVGSLDPVTPPVAAEEVVRAVPANLGRLELLDGAGHFPWLDEPDQLRAVLTDVLSGLDVDAESTDTPATR